MRAMISCVLVAVAGGAIDSAELKVRDVRLLGGAAPASDAAEFTYHFQDVGQVDGTVDDEDDTKLDVGPRVGILLTESWGSLGNAGGLLIGLSYSHSQQSSDEALRSVTAPTYPLLELTGPTEVTVNVFDLHVGWGYAFTSRLHIEAMVFGGIGSLTMEDEGNYSEGNQRTHGPYKEAGVRFGIVAAVWRSMLIGLEGGYLVSEGRSALRIDETTTARRADVVYEVEQSGPIANLSIGFRF
ncbi:MAG TPA: hypothetical protein VEL07_20020 [Planctomycetota bacterium]|nr:hypothetical protein [Planctomycetota bacterium]